MITAALRDLQFRRRRFAIATIGAALVFGLSVVMSGLAASFDREAERSVDVGSPDYWLVDAAANGPFTGGARMPASVVGDVASQPGVTGAGGVLFAPIALGQGDGTDLLNIIGVQPGQVGAPSALTGPGEAVVDEKLGWDVGETVTVAGADFQVVDVIEASMLAGVPNMYVDLRVAQAAILAGEDLVSSIVTTGEPPTVEGLRALTNEQAVENAVLRLENAKSTLALVRTILWVVAALVIGSVLYLNAQERTRDFAVFKATGATTRSIVIGLAIQATAIAVVASILAAIISVVLAPAMPMSVETPASAYVLLPIVVLIVSLLGSLAGARRAATVPPAVAFGG